jgi:hypothetical protein
MEPTETQTQPASSAPLPRRATRALIARHRRLFIALSLAIIVAGAAWLTWFYWPEPRLEPPTRAWYTVDDGTTRFADDAERIPPFDHDGKQAVRLHLFSCDGGKTTFIAYLQKIPEETFAKFRERGVDPLTVDDDELAGENGWLVKRPGANNPWINSRDGGEAYRELMTVRCPDGRTDVAREVFPENPKKN